ncbi:MAG: FecR domain-containing protein [Thiomonas sp.]
MSLVVVASLACINARGAEDLFLLTIRPGDTLIGISQRYLDRVDRWPALKTLNKIDNEFHLPPGGVLRIPAAWLRWRGGNAEVAYIHGAVRGTRGPLAVGMRLSEGETFDTGDDGMLTLRLRDGASVTFPPGTKARLGVLRQVQGTSLDDTAIDLERGATESRVPSLRSSGSHYEIRTPRVVTAVRGTHFRVAAADGVSRHELLAGALQLAGDGGSARLAPGQGLRADGGRLGAAVALLSAPDLSTLPDTVTRTVARLRLSITDNTGVSGWRWQVAEDVDFLRLLKDERTTAPEWTLAGLPDGDYFLRVRAADIHGIEGLDAMRSFALRARPEPPVMLAPAPAGLIAGAPVLRWAQNAEAACVRLQVARDAAFTDLLVERAGICQSQFAFAAALPPGNYHWRLASLRVDGYAGPLGDAAVFRQIEPTTMTPPEVADGAVRLSWSGPADLRYVVQIAAAPDFAVPVREMEVAGTQTRIDGLGGGVYYVRTRPVLPGDNAPWSTTQRFEIPVKAPWWLLLLVAPLLL